MHQYFLAHHAHIYVLNFTLGPLPLGLSLRFCYRAPRVPQSGVGIERTAPCVTLYALLEVSARLFFRLGIPAITRVVVRWPCREGQGEPDILGLGREPSRGHS